MSTGRPVVAHGALCKQPRQKAVFRQKPSQSSQPAKTAGAQLRWLVGAIAPDELQLDGLNIPGFVNRVGPAPPDRDASNTGHCTADPKWPQIPDTISVNHD